MYCRVLSAHSDAFIPNGALHPYSPMHGKRPTCHCPFSGFGLALTPLIFDKKKHIKTGCIKSTGMPVLLANPAVSLLGLSARCGNTLCMSLRQRREGIKIERVIRTPNDSLTLYQSIITDAVDVSCWSGSEQPIVSVVECCVLQFALLLEYAVNMIRIKTSIPSPN